METINNWIIQLEIYCDSEVQVGFIGAAYLVGLVLGSVTVTRIADLIGRKPVFMAGLVTQNIVLTGLIFNTNYDVACVIIFIIGFSLAAKYYVGYTYLVEMQPKDKQILIGCSEMIFEAFIYFFVIAYYTWMAKDWRYIMIPTISFGTVGSVVLIFLSESPRYMVAAGKYNQAR